VVFSGYSGFLHQLNWPARYNWNIVESGVKHHQTNKLTYKNQYLNIKYKVRGDCSFVDNVSCTRKQRISILNCLYLICFPIIICVAVEGIHTTTMSKSMFKLYSEADEITIKQTNNILTSFYIIWLPYRWSITWSLHVTEWVSFFV
jgi:hypothetical protein